MIRNMLLVLAGSALLAACMPPIGVLVINETGTRIFVHQVKESYRWWVAASDGVYLAPGRWEFLYANPSLERIAVSAGGCGYDYGSVQELEGLGVRGRVGVRLAPDFSASLISLDSLDGFERGQALPHDTIRPTKTCS